MVDLPPSIATFYELLLEDQSNVFVFTTPDGHPWRRSNFRQRYWRPTWDGIKADKPQDPGHVAPILPWFTFHEGRHTHSTWLAESGVPEVARRARLGHKMKGMARVYDHVTPEMRQQITDVLEQLWRTALDALTSPERATLESWFPHLQVAGTGADSTQNRRMILKTAQSPPSAVPRKGF